MQEKLMKAVGAHVRLCNVAEEQMEENKMQIHVHGTLEHSDEDNSFYVRIGEDPCGHGCNGITFKAAHVTEVSKQPSGIIYICLK